MRVCIHRGTKEIGGTCVEIESQGKRIVLDVGLPLNESDPDLMPLHPIAGFEKPDDSLLGVVISHPHQDHYGLAYRLPEQTLFLIGRAAQSILEAAELFTPAGVKLARTMHLEDRRPIHLGPFTITPYLVDHSAYDAYAVLVEADGKRLFYSGDLRAHGRKGALFEKLLRDPPTNVDVLLMEGTTLGRADTEKGFPTETDLEDRFVKVFAETKGMTLVWCSPQNIDRIVTIFRACKRSGRQFIIDLYAAHVLAATGNKRIPQGGWDQINVFVPESQRIQVKKRKEFALINGHRAWRIFPEKLAEVAAHSVMLFRPSMMREVEQAGCLDGSRLVFSMWSGYLRDEKTTPFLDRLRRHSIPLVECHTSGHATVADLARFRKVFQTTPLMPIHTDKPDAFDALFGNVQRRKDGEWWEVT